MYGDSIFKVIINSIKNFFKIIITLVASAVTSILGDNKKNEQKVKIQQETKKIEAQKKDKKKKEIISDTETTLPDEDNIKSNPHDDTPISNEIILEAPKKLYKVYTKDNELKYLTIEPLLDLLLKEELESMYKLEKFKLKTATTSELIKVDKIKERIYPPIIERAEKDILRNANVIRETLQEALIEDQLKNPLFPEHPKKDLETRKEEIINKVPSTNVDEPLLVENEPTKEIPKPEVKDEIKNIALVGATLAATAAVELLSPDDKEKTKEEPQPEEKIISGEDTPEEITKEETKQTLQNEKNEEEKKQDEVIEEIPTPKEIEIEKEIEELQEEINKDEEKTKEELEKLKEQVEEKIEEIKKEEKKKEEEKKKKDKEDKIQELVTDKEILDVSLATTALLDEGVEELAKEDFEERDYDKIERQINKMLDDITNTYLKYEKTLTPKQKEKLKKEEEKLRRAKDNLYLQKDKDIEVERKHLNDDILEIEKQGLQDELKKIHQQNEQEASPELFRRMETLEGLTKEQVANMDKRILLSRFRKANLILEMSSILALPFVRNKYFFAFTAGLIVDNHFNFINAFFRRKINRYEPADLEAIKKGQDALNSALDVTYKNLVELDYLEQQALSRYPELIYDPRYVSQITSLRTNLTKKYNKLMKKNNTMEKYRLKTKKHLKTLKKKKTKQEDENK